MYKRTSILNFFAISLSVVAVMVTGCDSKKTDGGGSPDSSSQFIATDDATGSISLNVRSTDVPVAGTTRFSVTVRDRNGAPVPQIRIACDTELGLALIEPTTGFELTDSFGSMSGEVGCEAPGSFQIGCRLPVGANKRKFETIHCEGTAPTGFSGFTDAGGRGLGGGVDTSNDEDDSNFGIRLTSVSFTEVGEEGPFIDLIQDICPDSGLAEPFSDAVVSFTVENNSTNIVRITRYRYVVEQFDGASNFQSEFIDLIGEQGPQVEGEGGVNTFTALFMDASGGGKRYFGTQSTVDSFGALAFGFKNVRFTLQGVDASGETVALRARTAVSLDNFNRCD